MKQVLVIVLLLCAAVWTPMHAVAAERTPAFLQPEVLKAALQINLTEEQKPQFQQALTDFVNGRMEAFAKLMKKNNQTNISRKMKSRTNGLLKDMDKAMASFLTEEQMPAYENYREKLKDAL